MESYELSNRVERRKMSARGASKVRLQSESFSHFPDPNPSILPKDLFSPRMDELELMHIKITVFDLSGILIEKKPSSKVSGKDKSATTKSKKRELLSSTSSHNDYTRSDENSKNFHYFLDDPFHAVISYKRKESSNGTSISSHLPSKPVVKATSGYQSLQHHIAHWPAQATTPLLNDNHCLLDQSSLMMERIMIRVPFEQQRKSTNCLRSFLPETVDLKIQLRYRSEMIPIGMASLVVTGEEDASVSMNVPVKPFYAKGGRDIIVLSEKTGMMMLGKNPDKGRKNGSVGIGVFKKKRGGGANNKIYFRLDNNATLRIAVQVISHNSLKETENALARYTFKEQRRREKQERKERSSDNHNFNYLVKRYERRNDSIGSTGEEEFTNPGFTHFLCSSAKCVPVDISDSDQLYGRMNRDFFLKSYELDNYIQKRMLSHEDHSYAAYSAKPFSNDYCSEDSSDMSSVSSSESESESEDGRYHLHRDIVIRRRT